MNERFATDGFFVVDDLFNAAECDDITAHVARTAHAEVGARP